MTLLVVHLGPHVILLAGWRRHHHAMMLVLELGVGRGVGLGAAAAVESRLHIPWRKLVHAGRIVSKCMTHHWHVHLHSSHW